jgi:hypothetical protein
LYLSTIRSDEEIEFNYKYVMPDELREKFSKSSIIDFNIKAGYNQALANGLRPKAVLEQSVEQHISMCVENSDNVDDALQLAELLKEEIEYRVRIYARCLAKTSENYVKWLQDEYKRKLKLAVIRIFQRMENNSDSDSVDFDTSATADYSV